MSTSKNETSMGGLDKNYLCHLRLERCQLSISHLFALLYVCHDEGKNIIFDEGMQLLKAIEVEIKSLKDIMDVDTACHCALK